MSPDESMWKSVHTLDGLSNRAGLVCNPIPMCIEYPDYGEQSAVVSRSLAFDLWPDYGHGRLYTVACLLCIQGN